MTFRWLYPFAALAMLFGLLVALPEEAYAAPEPAVGRDPGCVAALAPTVTDGDILGCDFLDRGRAVIALGDVATARDVTVLVPGSDIDLHTLDDPARPQRRPLGWARALRAAAGPDVAVVLWVGYATPQGLGVDAASGRLARAGAPALGAFVAGLRSRPAGPPHLTVIGHSYRSVVTALAAPGLAADDLVLLGSPGARADTVADLHTRARVWAARTEGDWMRWVPAIRIGDLGHGTDPISPGFGARLLPVGGTTGHDGYFRPGSAALAGIAAVTESPAGPVAVTA